MKREERGRKTSPTSSKMATLAASSAGLALGGAGAGAPLLGPATPPGAEEERRLAIICGGMPLSIANLVSSSIVCPPSIRTL